MPDILMVGVFDTAFNQTMEPKAFLYGLPYRFYEKLKIRRYGFHGISHKYVSRRAAEFMGQDYRRVKTIVCHLGNGASICAVKYGQVVDNSMGFTPLEGLVMGTRCGDVDAGALEYLAKKENLDFQQIMTILNQESGVLGISSNFSSDFRELKDAEIKYNDKAALAREIFVYRVAKYIGSYAAAMNGVDNIVFTAGVGENDSDIREQICEYLEFLGIAIDEVKNREQGEAVRHLRRRFAGQRAGGQDQRGTGDRQGGRCGGRPGNGKQGDKGERGSSSCRMRRKPGTGSGRKAGLGAGLNIPRR